ncbi:MAG: hypothetical protein ACP5IL_12895 [Syntrophobacteraceae bacterium]
MGAPSISVPPTPVVPPPPALPDQGVQNAATNQQQLSAMEYGAEGTILTGPQGLTQKANTTAGSKSLLG